MDQLKSETTMRKKGLPVWARILLVILVYIILTIIFQLIGTVIAGIPLTELDTATDMDLTQHLIVQGFGLIALILTVSFFRRFVDRESIASLGFVKQNRLSEWWHGFVTALVILGMGSFILYLAGLMDFTNFQLDLPTLVLGFLLFTMVSLNEEILIRGYILNNLLKSMGKYWALLISALIFMAFHLFNANLSAVAVVNLLLAGILLGSTYIYTRSLWYPISLHLFWNYLQGSVLGYSVSGEAMESVVKARPMGNDLISGGAFGFEGSLLCTLLIILAIGLVIRKHHSGPVQ